MINSSRAPLLETILSYTNGKGASAALDAVGGNEGATLARCVKEGGSMLQYGLLSGEHHPSNIRAFLKPGVLIKNYWLRNWVHATPLTERKKVFGEMIDCFLTYKLCLSSSSIFDLSEISKAVEFSESSNRIGKVLLKMQELSSH